MVKRFTLIESEPDEGLWSRFLENMTVFENPVFGLTGPVGDRRDKSPTPADVSSAAHPENRGI
jgi:hypothetical protein